MSHRFSVGFSALVVGLGHLLSTATFDLLAWTAILVHPTGLSVVSSTLLMFLMLTVVAVSSMLASSLPMAVLAATIPVTFAVALNFVLQGDLHNYILGIMAVAAQCYFTLLAHRLYTAGLATLVARAEKDALIAEREQAKMNSDEARRRAEESESRREQWEREQREREWATQGIGKAKRKPNDSINNPKPHRCLPFRLSESIDNGRAVATHFLSDIRKTIVFETVLQLRS
mgnify:CR=1 FL=1